eukprot:TRINITY_DN12388_c0_g1_i1.p1 TRINITY_DN12388_c0_g1~~TRINITY_DN12388_c0_g1_i1.p1  ORF type:complete len:277 (+),score=31.48 TRINITY_DN12388_c0_g1_i1:66-833(+)
MADSEICVQFSLSPERPSWAYRCGVFFDVVNKTDVPILITGLSAGSHGRDVEATLYACKEGTSEGHETMEHEWKVLWSGTLQKRSSTPLRLSVLLKLLPQATQGLLLVSKTYAVYHTTDSSAVEDDNIRICAGVRSTEHRGSMNPFDPEAQSRHERATPAGSITYMIGEIFVVTCQASAPDESGYTEVACSTIAGRELAVLNFQGCEDIADLRAKICDVLSSEFSDASSLHIELVSPEGAELKDGISIADALVVE